jgi:hypothetical protein
MGHNEHIGKDDDEEDPNKVINQTLQNSLI